MLLKIDEEMLSFEDQMIGLYRNICSILPDKNGKVIQFISSRYGEGTSLLIREFAAVVAKKLDKSVLLVDADPEGDQYYYLGLDGPPKDWKAAVEEQRPLKESFVRIGQSSLFFTQITTDGDTLTQILHSGRTAKLIKGLKYDYDLVLFDSPPAILSADGLILSHKMDGVIMVVEAENTRWQIVNSTKEKIEMREGNVIGVFLNKRRHYIPRFIYQRL